MSEQAPSQLCVRRTGPDLGPAPLCVLGVCADQDGCLECLTSASNAIEDERVGEELLDATPAFGLGRHRNAAALVGLSMSAGPFMASECSTNLKRGEGLMRLTFSGSRGSFTIEFAMS